MKSKMFIIIVLVCMAITSLTSLSVFAEEKEEIVVRVGYSTVLENFISDINSINTKGYGYEVFKKIEEVSHYRFEFVPIEGDLIEAVENGTVDMAGFNIKTPKKSERVLFSDVWFSKTYAALLSENQEMLYNVPEEINGKTVATYEDNLTQTNLDRYCEYYGISVEYVYGTVNDYMNLDTDFYIGYSQHKGSENKNNVLNLGVYNLYVISSFENRELMNSIDMIFYDVVASEGNFFLELEEKYIAKNIEINHRSVTKKEVEILRQRPLEVGYTSQYQPMSFTNEFGEPDGVMIDVLNLFAEKYDFEVNYHPYDIESDPSTYENYDILLSIYGDSEETLKNYDATEPYNKLQMFAQVKLDVHKESLTNRDIIEKSPTIGMLEYHFVDYNLFMEDFPNNEIVFYDDWIELLDAFATSEVDLIISSRSATTFAELYLKDVERVSVGTDLVVPMQFFISKEISEKYIPIFNVMIDGVSENEYESILNNNANEYYPEVDIISYIKENWYLFVFLAFIILVGILFFLYIQQKKQQKIKEIAYNTDSLTGFVAMNKFREDMLQVLETAKPNEYELISFDVDMFKTINTHYSSERGTQVIVSIANALKKTFKNSQAYITRRTADQFIILRKVDECGTIRHIYSANILPEIREVIGCKYNFVMSFGMVVIDDCKEKSTTIIGRADTARTMGKNKYETTFIIFDDSMKKSYENKVNVTFRMEQAIKDKEFSVVYQPKVNFKTLEIEGAEALVRWNPKLGETIYPDAFIPVFEENGFISTIDMYVLEEVCYFIKKNYKKMKLPRISVNLSAFSVIEEGIIVKINDILERYSIQPKEIEFEITESAIIDDEGKMLIRVKQLKKLGFAISIDDFGAGVSSLNRLGAIEADVLKLDKAFFDLKDQNEKSNVIISDVIQMAKHLNMLVVAEGVETLEQARWLKEKECDYAQGYYFEKPMSVELFSELLLSKKTYKISFENEEN